MVDCGDPLGPIYRCDEIISRQLMQLTIPMGSLVGKGLTGFAIHWLLRHAPHWSVTAGCFTVFSLVGSRVVTIAPRQDSADQRWLPSPRRSISHGMVHLGLSVIDVYAATALVKLCQGRSFPPLSKSSVLAGTWLTLRIWDTTRHFGQFIPHSLMLRFRDAKNHWDHPMSEFLPPLSSSPRR